jgi:putative Holliday junction resolvase
MSQRYLAVDPGEKRIGIAVSDPTGTIANPLTVVNHVSRQVDAAVIAQIAAEQQAAGIVIGQALDENGGPTPSARHAARLAEAIRSQTDLPVILWDESDSTQTARNARIEMGVRRKDRSGHMDDLAATVILQTFLDSQQNK